MSCELCKRHPGWSGYGSSTGDGWVDLACRCVIDKQDAELYGHKRNKIAMLKEIWALSQ